VSAPAVLFITSREIDLMQDILHEGLDELLGPERVWCYPYKDYSRFQYNLTPPSACNQPHREPVGRARLAAERDRVAAVVVGSVRPDAQAVWRALQDLFPDQPVALVNGEWSSPVSAWPSDIRYTHRFSKDLRPEDAAPGLYPLTYSVPPRVMLPERTERDIPVSFVARTTAPVRREVADALAGAGFLVFLDADLPREQYCWILNRSRIAVSVRGAAWDTLRYWEIPYHGALLLSERLPILIPDNFLDGDSAVFFDSPADMLAKIKDLLADQTRLDRIARAGRDLAWSKHTAPARARYVLEKMGAADLVPRPGPHPVSAG